MKVATWNVWADHSDRDDAIVECLRACDADLIALQEVRRSGSPSQAEAMGEALGMVTVEATPWTVRGGAIGNAVLSRLPVEDWSSTPLPVGDPAEPRTVVAVDVVAPAGPLTVLCTHLGWRPGEEEVRLEQARTLHDLALTHSRRGRSVLACGDLNAEPGSEVLVAARGRGPDLIDLWEAVHGPDGGATWDLRNPHTQGDVWPTRRIDFILGRAGDAGPALSAVGAELIGDGSACGRWPSDHLGVIAHLRM